MARRVALVVLVAGLCCGATSAGVYTFDLPAEESDAAWARAQVWLAANAGVFHPLATVTDHIIQTGTPPPPTVNATTGVSTSLDFRSSAMVSRRPRGGSMSYKVAVAGFKDKALAEMLAAYLQREVEACLSGTLKECREAFPDAVIQKLKR